MELQKSTGLIIGSILAVLVAIVGTYYVTVVRPDATAAASIPSPEQQREEVAKSIISSFLKSPGSAQFIDIVVKKMSGTENKYLAFGDVDSENSYSALLRTHFHFEMTYRGGDISNIKSWKIDSLDLGDVNLVSGGELRDTPLQLTEELLSLNQQLEEIYRGME